jgi:DNA polymerase III alpha subunit
VIKDKFGQYIYNENDVLDLVMREIDIEHTNLLVTELDTKQLNNAFGTITTTEYTEPTETLLEFDTNNQKNWYMPDDYKQLDIAEYVLSLCTTQEELQRCGTELLMYQDRNLFNLLRYLKYLVDTMKENNIIWGVGRGSSVSSYILFKMEVHKVDSMFYNLDVGEFLR